MKIKKGKGTSEFGKGVEIKLSAKDVCLAIEAYLVTKNIHYSGSRTMTINGELIKKGSVYIDPAATLVAKNKGWDCRKGEEQIIENET